jgi:hypothetical protein
MILNSDRLSRGWPTGGGMDSESSLAYYKAASHIRKNFRKLPLSEIFVLRPVEHSLYHLGYPCSGHSYEDAVEGI